MKKKEHHRTWAMVCSFPSCWTCVKGYIIFPEVVFHQHFPTLLLKPNLRNSEEGSFFNLPQCKNLPLYTKRGRMTTSPVALTYLILPVEMPQPGGQVEGLSTQRTLGMFSPVSTEKQHWRLYKTEETDTTKIVQPVQLTKEQANSQIILRPQRYFTVNSKGNFSCWKQ